LRVATPDALDALGGVAAGPPHEPIAIRLIRDIRPRCALAAAAHVAMMIDVVAIKFKNCRASISFLNANLNGRSRCPVCAKDA
jgi:hypothetical protein